MSSSSIVIGIIYVLALTTTVVPLAVGLEPKSRSTGLRRTLVALVFGATQAFMAFLGYLLGTLIDSMFGERLSYMVFAMMLFVAVKMMVDSRKVLKGKRMYAFTSNWGFLLLGILAGMNTLLMGICCQGYMPFDYWFFPAIAVAGILWASISIRVEYHPILLRGISFLEFTGAVFLLLVAVLYLFTDLT